MRRGIVVAAALLAGCQGEPGSVCDGERVVFALRDIDVDASFDVDAEAPGIQIDVLVRTSLEPGTSATLSIIDEEGTEFQLPGRKFADGEGNFVFPSVTLPRGAIEIAIHSSNDCRPVDASEALYVFDDMGRPTCVLELGAEPIDRPQVALPVYNAAADADTGTDGFQLTFRVTTGRADVDVTAVVLHTDSGQESAVTQNAGDGGVVDMAVGFEEGVNVLRVVCLWAEFPELPILTPTRSALVDTVAPGCAVDEPSNPVTAADDLDGNLGNGIQFSLVGSVTGGDAADEPASFTVNGQAVNGTTIDSAAQSTATATFPAPPPAVQTIGFSTQDRAGNPCAATVTL